MPLRLRFAGDDLLGCRFAVSPLCETHEAVRTILRPARHGYHDAWLRRKRPTLSALDLDPLPLLMPVRGYTPDFLGPPPDAPLGRMPGFAAEIERLRGTDPDLAHREMLRSFRSAGADSDSPARRALLADPAAAIRVLADATERAWNALIAPDWPRLGAVLEADITERSRRLAEGGLRALFADLHPDVRWADGALALRGGSAVLGEQELAGRGLLLMPSVFAWPDTISGFAPPWQPTVIYPARGMARAWQPPARPAADSLARLLGAGRAAVLSGLDEPASTTALARRCGLAASTVSAHLAVLRDAALVTARRQGHEVLYRRTALGTALVDAPG
ncbi:ArsR/SmtB family transcription factor [Cryptosporangium minutisporangium]|uniref:DUF5937 family protein n=1 Tax=Cryptosporangium minutisporangium TaxID=113569 RepID=A0ABP6SZH7_9ACTN